MKTLVLTLVAGLVTSTGQTALAKHDQDEDRKGWKDGDWDRESHRKHGEACFRESDIRVIHEYYRPRSLPPGLQKKLYRSGHLPPGWERKIQPFPVVVEQRLPPLCAGCVRGYMDGYAVVYQPRTRVIIDFHAVLP